jgi:hypothetical protein
VELTCVGCNTPFLPGNRVQKYCSKRCFYEAQRARAPAEPTETQKAIYDFIKETMEREQRQPTIREIGAAFGITSPNGVMCHLKALDKKGWIASASYQARSITLLKHRFVAVPVEEGVAHEVGN